MLSSILIVGTDNLLLRIKSETLKHDYETKCVAPGEALKKLRLGHFDLVLICCSTPFEQASSIIREAHAEFPNLPIVRLMLEGSPVLKTSVANAIVTEGKDSRPWIHAVDYLLHSKVETSNFY
jgi:DNA-binding response OmpR family regulator